MSTNELKHKDLRLNFLRKDYQEWLDELVNFEDHSVGVYWLGELDERKVKNIEESIEPKSIDYWDKETLIMTNQDHRVTFKLVTIIDDSKWIIAELKLKGE